MSSFFLYLCVTLFIFVCVFLILVVLIQKGRGGGLASAFGGSGGHTAFGSKTGDVLTWVTSVVFGVFLLLAIALNLLADAQNRPVRAAAAAQEQNAPTGNESATPANPAQPRSPEQALPPDTTPRSPTPPALPAGPATQPEK